MARKTQTVPRKIRIREGDKVMVIAGKDRGKESRVTRVFPRQGKVLVEELSSRFEITSSSDRACCRVTPAFNRAIAWKLWFSRTARSVSVHASGTHSGCAVAAQALTEKSAGITPTTV